MKERIFALTVIISIRIITGVLTDSGGMLYADELPCLQCHTSKDSGDTVHMAVQMGCGICHLTPHDGENLTLSLMLDTPDLCYMCHDSFEGKKQHTAVEAGMCTTCHSPHSSDNNNLLMATGSELCYSCHATEPFMKDNQHSAVTFGMCLSCHEPHAGENENLLVAEESELCFSCHSSSDFEKKVSHTPVESGNCILCHNPHSSENIDSLEKPIGELCSDCHTKESSGKHVIQNFGYEHPLSGFPDPARDGRALSCTSCHGPHGSESELLFVNIDTSPENLCLMCHES